MKPLKLNTEHCTLTIANKLELSWRPGAWCRFSEWVFGIDKFCEEGCLIYNIGWFSLTWLAKNHQEG